MQKFIISLICCLLPTFALAAVPEIRDNAPDRHIVVKGDTLWDISAKFFRDPWKWPQIWGMNKDTIADPHWIYPGDVIILDRTTGTLRIGGGASGSATSGAPGSPNSGTVKLSPRVHLQGSEHDAIYSIPADAIAPFLSRPLVVDENGLSSAPILVGTYEQRVLLGSDDIAYVKGMPQDKGTRWQAYRPGKALLDPDNKAVLGYEANYLGEAVVEKFADISTLKITKAIEEIKKGDRFTQLTTEHDSGIVNYVPHAPENQIAARVISIYGGVSQGGQNTIITLNKGRRDGLENGHVLALYRKGEVLKEPGKKYFDKGVSYSLPDMRYGLLFVFRTFDKVAYALVMQTRLPVELLDSALTP